MPIGHSPKPGSRSQADGSGLSLPVSSSPNSGGRGNPLSGQFEHATLIGELNGLLSVYDGAAVTLAHLRASHDNADAESLSKLITQYEKLLGVHTSCQKVAQNLLTIATPDQQRHYKSKYEKVLLDHEEQLKHHIDFSEQSQTNTTPTNTGGSNDSPSSGNDRQSTTGSGRRSNRGSKSLVSSSSSVRAARVERDRKRRALQAAEADR